MSEARIYTLQLERDIYEILKRQDVAPARRLIYEKYGKLLFSKLTNKEMIDVIPRLKELYGKKD